MNKVIQSIAAFAVIMAICIGVLLTMMGSGYIKQHVYREAFTVVEVGECYEKECSIKMSKNTDNSNWNGISKDLVTQDSKVYLLCDRNFLSGEITCSGFYTYPQSKNYEPRTYKDS